MSPAMIEEEGEEVREMMADSEGDIILSITTHYIQQYCDLRGRIKGNAEALHHVMQVARVSVHYAGHIARACIITYK